MINQAVIYKPNHFQKFLQNHAICLLNPKSETRNQIAATVGAVWVAHFGARVLKRRPPGERDMPKGLEF